MRSFRPTRVTLMPAVALATLGAVVAIPALSASRLHAASPQHPAIVTVAAGDSLWAIASRYTPADGSIQETVDAIVTANHLSSATVTPGESLRVPR